MADYGTIEGLGIGIGQAGQAVAAGIEGRGEEKRKERDKRADKIETDLGNISKSLVERTGGVPYGQYIQQPGDHSDVQALYAQMQKLISEYNSMYHLHETPQVISRWNAFGKRIRPQGPTPSGKPLPPMRPADPGALSTDRLLASTPLDTQSLMYQMNEAGRAYAIANKGEKDEQGNEIPEAQLNQTGKQKFMEQYLTRYGGSRGLNLQLYQNPKDGSVKRVSYGSPEEEQLQKEGWKLIPFASSLQTTQDPQAVLQAAMNLRDFGWIPKGVALQAQVGEVMREQGWAEHSKTIREGWVKDKNGVVWNVQLDLNNHIIPGTANRFRRVPPELRDQVRPGMLQWTDPQGQFHHQAYLTTVPGQTGNLETIADPTGQLKLSPAAPASEIPAEAPTVPEATPPVPVPVTPTVPSAVGAPLGATGATPPGAPPAAPAAQTTPPNQPKVTLGADVVSGQKETAESRSLAPRVGQAKVVLQSGNQLIQRIRAHPELFGPIHGRTTYLKVLAGGGTPEARAIYADLESFAALQGFFHGTRGIGALHYFSSVAGTLADKPENAIAATQVLMEQAQNFIAAGGKESVEMPDMIWVQAPGHAPAQIHSSQWDAFRRKAPNGVLLPGPPQPGPPQ
jgi:hypothetical protein